MNEHGSFVLKHNPKSVKSVPSVPKKWKTIFVSPIKYLSLCLFFLKSIVNGTDTGFYQLS